jgi:prepilin-type N-terminal cleavage/methylation domain-containing protein
MSGPTEARSQRGFSALELILAIAATAIVAGLGVSMYRTHSVRTQIVASVEEAGAAKALIVAVYEAQGIPPRDAVASGVDETTRRLLLGAYLESLEVRHGRLDLRFGQAADAVIAGKTLSLTPFETVDRKVVWICGNEIAGVGLQPLGFAEGGPRTEHVLTAIENRYLPPTCR